MPVEYGGYRAIEENGGVIVENVRDFNPVHIFECGQCFRWDRQSDGSYTGVAKGRAVNVRYSGGKLILSNATLQDFKEIWFEYFDLGRDYAEIKAKISKDEIMRRAVDFGYGIRLLRQELWETLISFISSTNKRIPMIMQIVAAIAGAYGDELQLNGRKYYSFPPVGRIADAPVEELAVCRGGYRCRYMVQTSGMVREGIVDLNRLGEMDTAEARNELMRLPGVGPKVADCVLLYSGTRMDVFPTDVWVKRVMEELYFKREAGFKEIQDFARDYFGELAGFAQQYLFYYARENKIGVKGRLKY